MKETPVLDALVEELRQFITRIAELEADRAALIDEVNAKDIEIEDLRIELTELSNRLTLGGQ